LISAGIKFRNKEKFLYGISAHTGPFRARSGTAAPWAAALVQDRTQESGHGETSATIKHGDSAKLGGYA